MMKNLLACLKALLGAGLDPKLKNDHAQTGSDLANSQNDTACADYFKTVASFNL